MSEGVAVYETPRYTAYIYPRSIVISTKYQAFRITCSAWQNQACIDEIILNIIKGKVYALSELRDFNGMLRYQTCNKPVLS